MTTTTASGAPPKPLYSPAYKTLVLSLLVLAYTFNFIDRTIIATIGQAIKVDLKITDAQIGLLGGLYFALLYTLLGIPLARLAERKSRVNIISGAIVIWSGFTMACGFAANFAMLALFRFGVGVGEAGLSPPAHSLISDYFEPKKRATALSIYSLGIPLGAMLGAIMGGFLTQAFSWRVAFMVVGLPGVLIALAIKLLIKEPPRGHSETPIVPHTPDDLAIDEPPAPPPTIAAEFREMAAVARVLFARWPVANMMIGMTLVSFAGYGGGQFAPPYFIRVFGLNYAQVGLLIGLVAGAGQLIGTFFGGPITDRLAVRGPRWYALVPAIGITLAYPAYVAIYTMPSAFLAACFLWVPGIFAYTYLGPTFGVVQNMVDSRRRATAAAVMLFFVNLIALGGGPPITGLVIDRLAAFHHLHPDVGGMWAAVQGLFSVDAQAFKAACPGGTAPDGAGAAAMEACVSAVKLGTRQGIILAYAVSLWGALHYFIASFGITGALAKARADRGEMD